MHPILDLLFGEFAVGTGVTLLIGAGFTLLADEFKKFGAAKVCFYAAVAWTYGKVLMWGYFTHESFYIRAMAVFLVFGLVGVGLVEALRLTDHRKASLGQSSKSEPSKTAPIEQKSSGANSPNIVGNGNIVGNTVIIHPEAPRKETAMPKVHPLIKQEAFSTLVPFITEESMGMLSRARIPDDSNFNDPLHLMYSEIGGISHISLTPEVDKQSGALKVPTLTDADMRNFLGRVLQYYILSSISKMQHTITYSSGNTREGSTSTTTSPVIVPDETEYPRSDLDKLLATAKIPIWPGELLEWKTYQLKVPKGTTVSFSEASEGEKIFYGVRFIRTPDFRLDFKIEPAYRNQGPRTFPKYFVPLEPNRIKDAYTYIFVVSLNFQWNGDRADGEAYVEWARELFSGLRKKLVIPN